MHLVGFIIRIYQAAWSTECQIKALIYIFVTRAEHLVGFITRTNLLHYHHVTATRNSRCSIYSFPRSCVILSCSLRTDSNSEHEPGQSVSTAKFNTACFLNSNMTYRIKDVIQHKTWLQILI